MPSVKRQGELAILAITDLVRRAGATAFQVGFKHDMPRVEDQGWYAEAFFGEKKITEEGRNVIDACMALAFTLLDNTLCRRCGRPITVFGADGVFCRFRIEGDHWRPGCGLPVDLSIPLTTKVDD